MQCAAAMAGMDWTTMPPREYSHETRVLDAALIEQPERMAPWSIYTYAAVMHFDRELDACGLNCPLPVLRAKKVLNEMSSGQVLKIVATDPGSVKDFQAFSKQTGNELLSHDVSQKDLTFFLKRK